VLGREQMTNLFVLVDSRLKPQKIDLEFIQWLGEHGVPFSIVFTKMDKLGKVAGPAAVEEYKKELHKTWDELPLIFMTSSEDSRGRDELLGYIDEINKQLKQQ
jgi:GTP-binding protein